MISLSAEQLAYISVFLAIVGYIPYIRGIFLHQVKPHALTWAIWTLLIGIAYFAQFVSGAGPGAWCTGFSTMVCALIFILSLFYGEKNITRSDWICFFFGLAAIPLWKMTDNPLYAVIIVTIIDILAFMPTFRKSWHAPHQENALAFSLASIKFILSLLALETFSWTTALYPASLVFLNGIFVAILLYRRSVLTRTAMQRA